MKWITIQVALVLWCAVLIVADVSELKSVQDSRRLVTKLDPVLRKALLRALSNLNNEEDSTEENITVENVDDTTDASEVLEESTRSTDGNDDGDRNIHFHSFIVDANNNQTSNSQSGSDEEEIFQTIIIKKPKTTLSPPFFSEKNTLEQLDSIKEADNDIEIDSVQVARSVAASVSANENNVTPLTTKATTTPATTTTTTEAPVTNADGENIEKADDVKILQAPLVAAFTVQQDEQGQPKNVFPIFSKNTQERSANSFGDSQTIVTSTTPRPTSLSSFATTQSQSSLSTSPGLFTETTERNDILINTAALQEKQRQLEEQIAYLQAQQRQQEELLRQAQLQNFQRQQQFAFQERLRTEEDNRQRNRFQPVPAPSQRFQVEQRSNPNNNNVQFIPSVSSVPISIQQQLPVKEPADFRVRSNFNPNSNAQSFQQVASIDFSQPQQQQQQQQRVLPLAAFNQIPSVTILKSKEQEVPPQLATFPVLPQKSPINFQAVSLPPLLSANLQVPLKPFQPFRPLPQNSASNAINQVSIEDSIARDISKNRVFRNDATQTGNFGFNQQTASQIQQQNFRPVQSFNGFQPPSSAHLGNINFNDQQQIQNLLLRSGVSFNQRSAEEDFNIISKVLALNHGINPSQTNNLGLGFQNPQRFR